MNTNTPVNRNILPLVFSAIGAAAQAVREYANTEQSKAVVDLLQALETQYLVELRTVTQERLPYTQGKLAQVSALRMLLQGDNHTDGYA